MKALAAFLCCLVILFASTPIASAIVIEKPPDFGPFWHPLGNSGTFVYADGFFAPAGDTQVSSLGTWLLPEGASASDPRGNTRSGAPRAEAGGGSFSIIRFQIWGTNGVTSGPDYQQVLASTDPMSTDTPGLNFYSLPVTSGGGPLTPGIKYWFVATGVGLGGPGLGSYQVGGHTQNSIYPDNCTFWYSNDATGQLFDGQNNTPEMAFRVVLTGATPTENTTWGRIKSLYR